MTTSTRERTAPAGGSFMIGPAEAGSVFTPERLSDEHRAMRDAVKTFVEREVGRQREAVEGKDYATHRSLLERLGKDGYLGIDIPEQYGGAGLDRISSLVVNEAISTAGSFAVTYSAHTGIGTLPLVFFGTDAQKRRFLPGLADGSLVGAYALTEPSAGSDAMAIRTRATQQPDGSWRLDGSKQFITNAAFADLFTIYAKIDGEQPTFEGELAAEAAAVAATRTVTLLLAGAAVQRFGTALEEQEEILAGLADLAIDLFAMESSLERAMQATTDDAVQATAHADLASLVIAERSGAVEQRAKWLVGSLAEGDEARTLRAGVRRLLRGEPLDRVALIRRVAATVIAAGGYPV